MIGNTEVLSKASESRIYVVGDGLSYERESNLGSGGLNAINKSGLSSIFLENRPIGVYFLNNNTLRSK